MSVKFDGRSLRWVILSAFVAGLMSSCGSETGTLTSIPTSENGTSHAIASSANASSALFDSGEELSLEDTAEILATLNLPDNASTSQILTAARLLLQRSEALAPTDRVASLANADVAQPVGILDLTDVAVVLSTLQIGTGEVTEEAIASGANQLLNRPEDEPFLAREVRVIPGETQLGDLGQPGGLAIVEGDTAALPENAIATINRLPSSVANARNIVFPPGSQIVFPAPPDRDRALRVSSRPRLMATRNEEEEIASFSATELQCSSENVCSLDGLQLLPEDIEAIPDDYLLTYTFRYSDGANGAIEESVQRVLTVLEQNVPAEPVFETLVAFDGTNGSQPLAGLVRASDGNFYGTTSGGGANNMGTIFRMTPDGVLTTLVDFDGTNGSSPFASLVEGSNGNLYGTTLLGGETNLGTIFLMTLSGEFATLVHFSNNGSDGFRPRSPLIEASDGNFYGTTSEGGAFADGSIFRVSPEGMLKTLLSFDASFEGSSSRLDSNASVPDAGLIEASDGNFYGITRRGGSNSTGVVFQVTLAGELTTIASLPKRAAVGGSADKPAGLLEASDGNFYGTTPDTESTNRGNVFTVTPTGELSTLVVFDNSNGSVPAGGLIEASDGNFYGTTKRGGTFEINNRGTVYQLTPEGTLTTLFSFSSSSANGSEPLGRLVESGNGVFYGVTRVGGVNNQGTIFRLSL